jgi:hypothetical protein
MDGRFAGGCWPTEIVSGTALKCLPHIGDLRVYRVQVVMIVSRVTLQIHGSVMFASCGARAQVVIGGPVSRVGAH